MKKLKMSSLTITLYVFAVLSLAYTVYSMFTTYESLVTYYSSYDLSSMDIAVYVLQTCYTSFGITIILYGLAGISDMLYKILHPTKEEPKVEEEKVEEVKEEPAEEIKEPVEEKTEEVKETVEEEAVEEVQEDTKENETEE